MICDEASTIIARVYADSAFIVGCNRIRRVYFLLGCIDVLSKREMTSELNLIVMLQNTDVILKIHPEAVTKNMMIETKTTVTPIKRRECFNGSK